jgi:CMP/dCMP kinase
MTAITIAREFGSGGRKIAAQVSELLSYRFVDKWLMARVAADVGLSEADLIHFSDHHNIAERFVARFDELLGAWSGEAIEIPGKVRGSTDLATFSVSLLDEKSATALVNTAVLAAHKLGNVVIVGRGAEVILKDKPDVLHVRIESPMETRLWRLRNLEGLSAQEARQLIDERDRAVTRYMTRCYHAQWDNPFLYHLVINTGKMQPEWAAQLIVDAVRQLQTLLVHER